MRLSGRPVWHYLVALGVLNVFGWFAFVEGQPVPLISFLGHAVHEFGHVVAEPLPDLVTAMAGSGFQVLLPLGFAIAFALRDENPVGAALCLGASGVGMKAASVYIADAPMQALPLTGAIHDWNFALERLGALHHAATISQAVWTLGLLLLFGAVVICAAAVVPLADDALAVRLRQDPA